MGWHVPYHSQQSNGKFVAFTYIGFGTIENLPRLAHENLHRCAVGEDDIASPTNDLTITSRPVAVGHFIRAQMGNSWRVPRYIGRLSNDLSP